MLYEIVRTRAFLIVALALSAVLAAGSAVALTQAGSDVDDGGVALPTTSATPSATSSPIPEVSESPTESPSPAPSLTPTAAPSPSTAPRTSAPRQSSPRATSTSGSTRTFAYPKPSRRYEGLELTVTSDRGEGEVGDLFTITATATDGDGTIYFTGLTWGDGSGEPAEPSPRKCKDYPPLTSPPGEYRPQPDREDYRFTHRYAQPGEYVITFRVASVNADCRPNGPANDSEVLQLPVTVKAPSS